MDAHSDIQRIELHTGEDVTASLIRRRVGFPYLTVEVDGTDIFVLRNGEGPIVTEPETNFAPPMMKEFRRWFDAYDENPRDRPGLLYTRPPGTPWRVGLVACSKSKGTETCPAQDLYTGDLFRKARAWAEKHCDDWGILSAEHRLLRPEHEIDPYEKTLASMDKDHLHGWARSVNYQVYMEWGEETTYVLLCGELYRKAFEEFNDRDLPFEVPMRGLGMGEQKRWLKENL